MSLVEKINEDIKIAMKAREKEKLEALRAVKSAILLLQVQDGAKTEISEKDEIQLLQKLVKQRKDAAEIYREQSRNDLCDVELFQADIIEKYLPAQLSEAEVESIIKEIIATAGATSAKDLGKVMGIATKQLAGKADNNLIVAKAKALLS